ncbi:MAG TPA: hypothetical protein VN679_07675 [Candidatus Acidoferrales bacterium]|nr:hypothetical protein [Candidatus Acidoferrales bacterium]
MLTDTFIQAGAIPTGDLFSPSKYSDLLKYGILGLILGLSLAALTFLSFVKLDRDRVTAIKAVLGFGLAFAVVGGGFWLADKLLNPAVYVSVAFNPKPDPNRPDGLPFPEISTNLDQSPAHGQFLVKANSQINVDMAEPLRKYAEERAHGKDLLGQVSTLTARNVSLTSIASRAVAFKTADALTSIRTEVTQTTASGSTNPLADAAAKVCNPSEGGPSCGIAKLARGDVAAAQLDFSNALTIPGLNQAQRVATHNGLGYTYVLQGDKAKAAAQFKISGQLGDKDAATRLNELRATDTAPLHAH